MEIPRLVDAAPQPPLLGQLVGPDEFDVVPGGRPLVFPPGLEWDIFRNVVMQGSDLEREEFVRRYPEPSLGPAFRDILDASRDRLIDIGVLPPLPTAPAPAPPVAPPIGPPMVDQTPPVGVLIQVFLDP